MKAAVLETVVEPLQETDLHVVAKIALALDEAVVLEVETPDAAVVLLSGMASVVLD